MHVTPDHRPSESTRAAAELAALHEQIETARAVLEQLQRAIADAARQLGDASAATLVAANTQLVLSTLRAQTEAQAATQALEEAARTTALDTLTQLPTRAVLLDRLGLAMANAKRYRNRAALLFVDLDNFKQINDSLGHAVGDEMIQLAARRLSASVREGDTVSRYGGDEFLILLAEVCEAGDAAMVAGQIITTLAAPHRMSGRVLRLTASIGISLYPDHGEDPLALIGHADAAMYRAKRHGAGGFAFHCDAGAGEEALH